MKDERRGDFTITTRVVPIAVLAVGCGVVSAVLAKGLLALIALFTNLFFFGRLSVAPASPADHALGPLVILVPVVGGLVVGLLARFGSDRIRGHGIPEAIEAILLKGSLVEAKVAVLKPLSAAISIGSGGPFGAEGPIIMTGGAVGSLIAQTFHLTAAERKTLLVAGAAAGMSAVFDTPVAATLLAVELLLFEWKPRSVIPVMLASATAAVLRPALLGEGPLFPVPTHAATLHGAGFVACLVAGVLAGASSGLLTRGVYAFEDAFARLPVHWMWWPALGGLVVGVGGWIEPRALGVGYENIADLLDGTLVGAAVGWLIVVKGGVWIVSLGSGTSGGVLAPLLTLGAALGGVEATVFPDEGTGFWPLVSMGAILGGTMRAPLTAVAFALELTHDLDTMLPLLVAVAPAYLVTALFVPRSILTEKIARRGFHVSREYAIDPLEILFVREVMSEDVLALPADATIADAKVQVAATAQRLFPVVRGDALVGVVTAVDLDDRAACLGDVARPAVVARPDDILREIVYRMASTGHHGLVVIDPADTTRILGLVTLEHLLEGRVRHLDEETRRERPLDVRLRVASWLRR